MKSVHGPAEPGNTDSCYYSTLLLTVCPRNGRGADLMVPPLGSESLLLRLPLDLPHVKVKGAFRILEPWIPNPSLAFRTFQYPLHLHKALLPSQPTCQVSDLPSGFSCPVKLKSHTHTRSHPVITHHAVSPFHHVFAFSLGTEMT